MKQLREKYNNFIDSHCHFPEHNEPKFRSALDSLLETAMRDAYNEARNQTPYIDFDDYFAQIKETLINK